MVLTPEDIANKDFSRSVRGFNENEVNDFLDEINDNYARTLDENASLKNQLSAAQEKVKYFSGLQDALNKSILIAQQTADRVKKDAEKERDRIIYDAENDAKKVLKAATEKANQIQEEAIGQKQELSEKGKVIEAGLKKFHQQLVDTFKQQLEYSNDENWINLLQSHFSENLDDFKHFKTSEVYDDVTESLLSENPDLKLDVDPSTFQETDDESSYSNETSNNTNQQDQTNFNDLSSLSGQFNQQNPIPTHDDMNEIHQNDYGVQQESAPETIPDLAGQTVNNQFDPDFNNPNSQGYVDPYGFNSSDANQASYYPNQHPNVNSNPPYSDQGGTQNNISPQNS